MIDTIKRTDLATGSIRLVKRDVQPSFVVIVDRLGDQVRFQPYYQGWEAVSAYNALVASIRPPVLQVAS